jgi:hypothetical protein
LHCQARLCTQSRVARVLAGAAGDRRRGRLSSHDTTRETAMAFAVGTAVMAQAKSTSRGPRSGVIEEVLRGDPQPRYRIRWDDGHESTVTPSGGTLQRQPRRARAKQR